MDEKRTHGQVRWIFIVTGVLLMPVAYVLSMGPIAWLHVHAGLPYGNYWLKLYCAPIGFLAQNSAFGSFLKWYLAFWE
jgi:hypothetical protein